MLFILLCREVKAIWIQQMILWFYDFKSDLQPSTKNVEISSGKQLKLSL